MLTLIGHLYDNIFNLTNNIGLVFLISGILIQFIIGIYPEYNKLKVFSLNKKLASEIDKIKNNSKDEAESALKINELYKKNNYNPSISMISGFILTVFYIIYIGIIYNPNKYIDMTGLNFSFLGFNDLSTVGFDFMLPISISIITTIAINLGKPLENLKNEVTSIIVSTVVNLVLFCGFSFFLNKIVLVFFLGVAISRFLISLILVIPRRKAMKNN